MKLHLCTIIFGLLFFAVAPAKERNVNYIDLAKKAADTEIKLNSNMNVWSYKSSFLCGAYLRLFEATEDSAYFRQAKSVADKLIDEQGVIETFDLSKYDLRNMYGGTFIYDIYQHNRGGNKYLNALTLLRKQFHTQPRMPDRAFGFTKEQTDGIRLEGLLAMPFYCLYASIFDESKVFNDIMIQFSAVDEHTLNKDIGLNYQAWTNNKGAPSAFFSQSIGFYMVSIVEVLDYFPINHPYRVQLIKTLNRLSIALLKYQDSKSGMWYQITNLPKTANNYLESSATAMFAYAIAKGVNKGYLPGKHLKAAKKAFMGLANNCIENGNSFVLTKATTDADLQENNGTFEYYAHLTSVNNEAHAIAAFILVAVELSK